MVTVSRPATDPANDTVPAAIATTGSPGSAAKSIPQWPAYGPCGAKGRTTRPGTGRTTEEHTGTCGGMSKRLRATTATMLSCAGRVQP
jgi:hypothetical protein